MTIWRSSVRPSLVFEPYRIPPQKFLVWGRVRGLTSQTEKCSYIWIWPARHIYISKLSILQFSPPLYRAKIYYSSLMHTNYINFSMNVFMQKQDCIIFYIRPEIMRWYSVWNKNHKNAINILYTFNINLYTSCN